MACPKSCPVGDITRTVPQFDDVLELYYHCKICSAPQAYLEQDVFLEHIQEAHPEYCVHDGQETRVIFITYPENKAESTTDEVKMEVQTVHEAAEQHTLQQLEQASFTPTVVEPQVKTVEGAYDHQTHVVLHTEDEQAVLALGESETNATTTDTHAFPQGAAGANEMELVIEWPAEYAQQHTKAELAEQILQAFEQNSGELIVRDNKVVGHVVPSLKKKTSKLRDVDPDWVAESNLKVKSEPQLTEEVKPPKGACRVCSGPYTHKHVATCKKPHKTGEKPSCDAYVCGNGKNEPTFPCPRCERVFLKKVLLWRHMDYHVAPLNSTCDKCSRHFPKRRALISHLIRGCIGHVTFECRKCNKIFANKQNLIRHLQAHAGIMTHICQYCGKGFLTSTSLKIHVRNHTGEKPYKCSECDRAFRSRSQLMRHSYTHSGAKKFVCEICGSSYVEKSGLARHMPVHNEGGRPVEQHECKYCHKVLRSKRTLVEHYRSFHANLTPQDLKQFPCDICGKMFRTRRNVVLHKDIHTNNRRYPCETCGKKFYRRTDVKQHMRSHTGEKPYKCDICGKGSTSLGNMQKHRMIHTGEKPHKCKMCGRAYSDPSHLKRHLQQHTGIKPFECSVCGRRFFIKAQLAQHMLIHADVAPFICAMCGKTFRQRAKANRHKCLYTNVTGTMPDGHGGTPQERILRMSAAQNNSVIIDESGQPIDVEAGEMVIEEGVAVDDVLVKVIGEHGERVARVLRPDGAVVEEMYDVQ